MSYFPIEPADSLSVQVVDLNEALDALARDFQGESAPSTPSSFQRWIKPSTFVDHFRNVSNSTWVPWQHVDVPSGFYFSDGADHILLRAPADVGSGGYTLVLPGAQGANNQYLRNDGSGNLSWVTLGAGVSALDDLSDVTITTPATGHYIRHNGSVFANQLGVTISDLVIGSEANGDLIRRSGGAWGRLGVGSEGQVLTVVSGAPAWAAAGGASIDLDDLTDVAITTPATGHLLRHNGSQFVNQLGLAIGDLTVASAAQGDLIRRGASAFERLAVGTAGQVLTVVGGVPAWAAATGGGATVLDDLTDVSLSAPGAGRYLRHGGSAWQDSALLLTDLSIGSQANGDVAYFNGTVWTRLARGASGQFLRSGSSTIAWESVALGATELDGLSDVDITTPAAGHILRHTGTRFINQLGLAISDLTVASAAQGDLIRRGASVFERLAVGTAGQVLTVVGGVPAWAAPAGGGALDDLSDVAITTPAAGHLIRHNGSQFVNQLGLAIGDLTVASAARGDIIRRGASAFERLPLGPNTYVLTSDGTDAVWAAPSGGGGGNTFQTIDVPNGTNPVADSGTDTLTFAEGTGIAITGDSSTDTVTFDVVVEEIDHDALANFSANEHFDRTGTVSITGAWSFDRSSASEVFLELANPSSGVYSLRLDGDLILLRSGFNGRLAASSLSASRTWNFPDIGGDVTIAGNSFTGTGSLVRATAPTLAGATLSGDLTINAGSELVFVESGGSYVIDCSSSVTGTVTLTLPQMVGAGPHTALLTTSKVPFFESNVRMEPGVELEYSRDSMLHRLGTVATMTGARNWDLPDASGEITCLGNAATGTGSIVRAASPTLSGTAIINAIQTNSLQTVALLLKELIGSNYLSMTCAATTGDYTINWPSSSTLPSSGTYYVKIDNAGNISFAAS